MMSRDLSSHSSPALPLLYKSKFDILTPEGYQAEAGPQLFGVGGGDGDPLSSDTHGGPGVTYSDKVLFQDPTADTPRPSNRWPSRRRAAGADVSVWMCGLLTELVPHIADGEAN